MQPFVKKYSPKNCSQVIAQDSCMTLLKTFVENFKIQKKKATLIYGPSGCGKTSSIYALSSELGLEIVEMNASDLRNKEQINSVVGAASQQMSLFGKGKIILIDELDGIAGRKDYGGVAALAKLIKESAWPMIITANNPFDSKFSAIRNKSELLRFKGLDTDQVYFILKNICNKEGISYDDSALKTLARRNAGDARGAINDLEIFAVDKKLSREDVSELSDRDKVDTMLNALVKIFKNTDPNIARSAFDNVEEDLDKCMLWLDENLPREYLKPTELAAAYDKLSRADVFRGRIPRWQHWRLLTYASNLMTAGVAVCKDERSKLFVQYKPTGRILKLWWAKQKSMKKKAIALKIAEKTHTSVKQMIKNIDYFKIMFKDKVMADNLIEYLDLNNDEIAWLRKV